jgi:hypothetical protein
MICLLNQYAYFLTWIDICDKFPKEVPKMILDSAKKGNHVVLEISPKFFSTWDFPKVQ